MRKPKGTSKAHALDRTASLDFGGGSSSNGKTNALYFTAGPNNGKDGLFGVITFK